MVAKEKITTTDENSVGDPNEEQEEKRAEIASTEQKIKDALRESKNHVKAIEEELSTLATNVDRTKQRIRLLSWIIPVATFITYAIYSSLLQVPVIALLISDLGISLSLFVSEHVWRNMQGTSQAVPDPTPSQDH